MESPIQELQSHVARIARLSEVASLVGWDQQCYMPSGAVRSRAEQSAVLSELIHEMFIGAKTATLLEKAEADTAGMEADSDERRMLTVLRRDFDRATKLPTELVMEMSRHAALSHEVWVQARASNNFDAFVPALEKMFDLVRQQAECYGYTDHIYDALIDAYEPGAKQSQIAAMLDDIKPGLVELNRQIAQSKVQIDDSVLYGHFPAQKQSEVTIKLVSMLGFDFNRGRQDVAPHPFCTNFSRDDVRLTTRYDETNFCSALYSCLHEAGHGLYEQGLPAEYEQTPLGSSVSLGVHESQSRLWENLVGRSRAYTNYIFPILKDTFPDAFGATDIEAYYRAINKVSPSLIRVEADEATYNLHIMLRFELECELLTGKIAFADLPKIWNERMEAYLGIVPDSDANGVLQDVHWSEGLIGYFPTYSIGNLLSAQLIHAYRKLHPNLDEQLQNGAFAPLLTWLNQNVHAHCRKLLPNELIVQATGEPLTSRYYLDYLTKKYSEIYEL